VRFTYGTEFTDGPMGVSFAQYDYLQLADVNLESGETRLTDEYRQALEAAGIDPLGEESGSVLDTWQDGWNGIVRGLKGHVGLDPMSGTPGLKAKLEARVYQDELTAPAQSDEEREAEAQRLRDALRADYDWQINISTEDDGEYEQGLEVVEALKEQYGRDNVLVTGHVQDADTQELTRSPGKLGVFVRKGAPRLTDQ
jgi:hypothetical protein